MLHNEILADVPHAQWVFSIPKMLRPYFLHHRELLGDMARLAYDTVREMKILAFITDPTVIRKILDHRPKTSAEPRAPPEPSSN